MRKISEQAADAFVFGIPFNKSNTKVVIDSNKTASLYLHDNLIAENHMLDGIKITNAGWFTNVTKERLNALPNGVSISQCKGIWYLNGKEWDGSWIKI